jgi:helicase
LREGVFSEGALEFIDGETRTPGPAWTDLVAETVSEGGQLLVFTRSRKEAEKNAGSFGATLGIPGPDIEPEEGWGEVGRALVGAMKGGAGFHHAGLGSDMRRIVEKGFRDGDIKVLFATPTLAAGINLPARRVIVLTTRRYERAVGMTDIPVLEVRQMMGRAGRPGLDPHGEAVIVAKNDRSARRIVEDYILGEVEPITSKLLDPRAMRIHVLSAIATGECRSEEDIEDFLSHTFYAHTTDLWTMESALDHTLEMLEEGEFIEIDEGIAPTPLGVVTSRVYIDPASSVLFRKALDVMPEGVFHHLMTVSSCPDMYRLAARKDDPGLERFSDDAGWLKSLIPHEDYDDALRTSAVLNAWISEMLESDLTETFGIGPGDLHNLRETATWLGMAYAEIAGLDLPGRDIDVKEVARRLESGVKPELLPLMRVPGIGRRRGRTLYGAGYREISSIGRAEISDLEGLPHMGPATARQAIEWSRRNWRRNQRNRQ